MVEITANVNWVAVAVGTVISFLLGWLWYSPKLFGTKWAEGCGLDIAGPEKPPVAAMIVQLLGTFLLAWVIGVTAVTEALLTAILIVLAAVFLLSASGLFVNKSTYAVLTEAGFVFAMAIIMIVCQGVF